MSESWALPYSAPTYLSKDQFMHPFVKLPLKRHPATYKHILTHSIVLVFNERRLIKTVNLFHFKQQPLLSLFKIAW